MILTRLRQWQAQTIGTSVCMNHGVPQCEACLLDQDSQWVRPPRVTGAMVIQELERRIAKKFAKEKKNTQYLREILIAEVRACLHEYDITHNEVDVTLEMTKKGTLYVDFSVELKERLTELGRASAEET